MNPHWQITAPFTATDALSGTTITGERGTVERIAACFDGCVGIVHPERVRDAMNIIQLLAGNLSPERHRENGEHVRAEVAEIRDLLGLER